MIRYFFAPLYAYICYICIFLFSYSLIYCTSSPETGPAPTDIATEKPGSPSTDSGPKDTSPADEIVENSGIEENRKVAEAPVELQKEEGLKTATAMATTHKNQEATRYLKMTDKEKIAQLLIVRINIPSTQNTSELSKIYKLIQEIKPGGVILFNNSLNSHKDLHAFIYNLQQNSTVPLFVSIDVEGGAVNRLKNIDDPLLATIPSPRTISLQYTPQELEMYAFHIGEKLLSLGINMNLAPVADVRSSITPAFLVERIFGDTPEKTALYTNAYISGIQSAKVMAVIKHFPGHGAAAGDPHLLQVKVHSSKKDLQNKDMLPFRYAIAQNVSAVMLGHMVVPAIDKDNSASASKKIISILKNELHFNGLVMTDSLKMKGVLRNNKNAHIETTMINAGVDILLDPVRPRQLVENLLEDLHNHTLSRQRIRESVTKILAYKTKWRNL